ncbi:TPA: hypothetical protein UDO34_000471 [Streptococcus suis]|nr:hypothetical protein [Streptococcus suis]
MEKQIIIFLKNGETLLFQDVSNVDVTDEYVAFDYFGKSTNQRKKLCFLLWQYCRSVCISWTSVLEGGPTS